MADMDDLVEKAACAHYESLEWGGCAGGGWIRQPEGPRNDRMDAMRAALEAVGLPALLERVEAAEAAIAAVAALTDEWESVRCGVTSPGLYRAVDELRDVGIAIKSDNDEAKRQDYRDALAAKVARVEALAKDWEYAASKIQQDAAPTPQNRADVELLVSVVDDLRAALTEGTEG